MCRYGRSTYPVLADARRVAGRLVRESPSRDSTELGRVEYFAAGPFRLACQSLQCGSWWTAAREAAVGLAIAVATAYGRLARDDFFCRPTIPSTEHKIIGCLTIWRRQLGSRWRSRLLVHLNT